MTTPMRRPEEPASDSPVRWIEPGPLWAGGVATAIVAAMIALVGILVSRWLFTIPILAPRRDGAWGDASTGMYVLAAAGAALAATAIMHLLLLTTPRPQVFFGWIIGLATIVAVVFPFSTTAAVDQKFATALVNLVLGIAIGTLLGQVAGRAVRRRRPGGGYQSSPPPPPSSPPSRTVGDQYR
ncbi:MAG TPA: DUF6069 family protein [Streptosporangiaceae bacterium]|nr:DUF6069 family protein [Streptosporangiaceae bacterium]